MRSHAAWRVTRRRPASLARRTRLRGDRPGHRLLPPGRGRAAARSPSCASAGGSTTTGAPSPASAAGGSEWSTPCRCATRRRQVATTYTHAEAIEEARAFLAGRPYVPTDEAQRTLATIRRRARRVSRGCELLVVPKWYPWPEQPVFGIFCREHARALATRHDVVVLASLATRSPGLPALSADRRGRGRPAHACACATGARGFARWRWSASCSACWPPCGACGASGFRPDVVHAHVFSAGLPALLLGRLSARRGGGDRALHRLPARPGDAASTASSARAAFRGADLVAPVSEELAGHLREIAPRARIEVMPNTVDTEVFTRRRARAPRRPARGCSRWARWPRRRATRTCSRRWPRCDGRRDVTLDVVGDGELREPLEARAPSWGSASAVRFHGELPKERGGAS